MSRKPIIDKNTSKHEHFKDYDFLLSRIDDLIKQNEKYQTPRYSIFLKPNECAVITKYLGTSIQYRFDGGFPDATFKRLIIGDDHDNNVRCLICHVKSNFVNISHRDILGALMNLGLVREQFGDLWIDEDLIVIYVASEITQYVIDNLEQINKLKVKLSLTDEVILPNEKLYVFTKTIASFRLDSVVSALLATSRNNAQVLIKQKLVFVNYETLEENSYLCNNYDTISVRGYGRYIIMEVIKITKKERLLLKFGKYE